MQAQDEIRVALPILLADGCSKHYFPVERGKVVKTTPRGTGPEKKKIVSNRSKNKGNDR